MHSLSPSVRTSSFRADLHAHSSCSDGTLTPLQLIDEALEQGLTALSITDHDTVEAYPTAIPYAKEKGLILGVGVELSCTYRKRSIHVLAYDFPFDDPSIQAYCQRQHHRRELRNRKILERLSRLHMSIKEEELLEQQGTGKKTLGRPHIAALMVQKGYVHSVQEAFHLYLGDTKCCFVQGELFSVQEAIAIIHQARGKAFLAHPHLYEDPTLIREVLDLGFDGLECYYARYPLHRQQCFLRLAKERGLLISGGSDFHGEVKPTLPLGCSFVEKESFYAIFSTLSP